MEFEQLVKRLEWVEGEHRKAKTTILTLEERIAESRERAPRNPLFDQADSLLTRERLVSAVRPPRKR